MHAADRTHHKNEIIFLETLEPERIIFQYLDPVHNFLLTMVFAEKGGKTRLARHQRFESTAHSNQVTALLMKANDVGARDATEGEQGFMRIMPGL